MSQQLGGTMSHRGLWAQAILLPTATAKRKHHRWPSKRVYPSGRGIGAFLKLCSCNGSARFSGRDGNREF